MGTEVFYFVATLSVVFSLMVVFAKNPIHSVLYLILTFFTFTVHYVLLNAQFLAVVNFIVYMGAIMVLFLFVLMLLNLNKDSEPNKSMFIKIAAIIAGGCLLVTIIGSLKSVSITDPLILKDPGIGLVEALGKQLFGPFMLPFELSSVLLLSAMVGAVLLTKKEEQKNG
ncbi:NADH-quinone oxidoreductase subunit J family protein [Pedobacter flavus]|uniref:NADH-quinone oxidoreductase subunit J n=1 Tax=Pedobacter flavus TaxID=3113906 RepID=A0ABU7H070_9SPHI|nr:NADH-quinone oxidoreductase subunit J [Pedobacter sp. VNH31]MEE1884640.1 NADH-quinone oxidoreductase subunit J [Pedobacter sp. VNH31]